MVYAYKVMWREWMKGYARRAWVEVSLDALENNAKNIKKLLSEKTKMMAVVKADAYGHGAVETAKLLVESGADFLGVACADEVFQLRKAGVDVPVLILGYISAEDMDEVVKYDTRITVCNFSVAKAVSNSSMKYGVCTNVHIKVDTGMNRLGFLCNDRDSIIKTSEDILDIARIPNIEIEGIFSHFSCADEDDDSYTEMQFERFMELTEVLRKKGLDIPIKHICNSAATLKFPQMHLDMVRPGLACMGLFPSPSLKGKVNLVPAMEFKAIISNIKTIENGERVSYGGKYVSYGKRKIATISIGYADGYSRLLSNRAYVSINGRRYPIVGNICMDQCMIDITDGNNISVEDEVILFGHADEGGVSVDELAQLIGTINYEVLAIIGRRVPRIYKKDDYVKGIYNYLA